MHCTINITSSDVYYLSPRRLCFCLGDRVCLFVDLFVRTITQKLCVNFVNFLEGMGSLARLGEEVVRIGGVRSRQVMCKCDNNLLNGTGKGMI